MPKDPDIHAIFTWYDDQAFGLHSPQLPSLFAGFDSDQETEERALEVLAAAGAPDEYQLHKHYQRYFHDEDGREWFIRMAADSRAEQRNHLLQHLTRLLELTKAPIDTAERSATGEVTFVITLPDDPVDWVAGQLMPTGCALTLVALDPVDQGLVTLDVVSPDFSEQTGGEERWTTDSTTSGTVADLLTATVTTSEYHVQAPEEAYVSKASDKVSTKKTLVLAS